MSQIAQVLIRPAWPFKVDRPAHNIERGQSKTETLRQVLRERGPTPANTLALIVDLENTGLVGALLKTDLAKGRVFLRGGSYHWNPQFDEALHAQLAAAVRLLRSNGYIVKRRQEGGAA